MYTFEEYADMYMAFGFSEGNAGRARIEYQRLYPNRNIPTVNTFRRLDIRLRETGNFMPNRPDAGRPRSRRTIPLEEAVLEAVDENPNTSARQIARQLNVPSQSTVHSVLRENLLKPYHYTTVQPLYGNDNVARTNYCHTLIDKIRDEPDFLSRILWSDECTFTRDGVFNTHNFHYWAEENPYAFREFGHQRRFNVNVWLGIVNYRIVGPIFLPNRLNGAAYLNVMEEVLENLPLNILQNMIFMHDGAPPHTCRASRMWLDENFPDRWIGRNGP